MKSFVHENLLQLLVERILEVFGKKYLLPSECKLLSENIYEATHKTVSETTLKRLFGFASRNSDFSSYTLETLAEYAGYKSWDDFYYKAIGTKKAEKSENVLDKARNVARLYSLRTMQAIRHSSGNAYLTIEREDFTRFIRAFLASKKTISPVIAPAGFGKSIALKNACWRLWMNDSPEFPDDICCFINALQLLSVVNSKQSLPEWIAEFLLQSPDGESAGMIWHTHHRLVLIIDGVDDRTISADKLKIIFANIEVLVRMTSKKDDGVKVILSMRPFTWKKLLSSFGSSAFFRDEVFIDNSYPLEDYVNHTLFFSESEVKILLQACQVRDETIGRCSPELIRFLSYPANMAIFRSESYLSLLEQGREEAIIYGITEIFIRDHFIFSACRKTGVIERIAEARLRSSRPAIPEQDILLQDQPTVSCYIQLFDNNILLEERDERPGVFPVAQVRFVNEVFESYFIAYTFLSRYNKTDRELIHQINASELPASLKSGIIRWLIMEWLRQGAAARIYDLFRLLSEEQADQVGYFEFLFSIAGEEGIGSLFRGQEQSRLLAEILWRHQPVSALLSMNESFLANLLKLTENSGYKKTILLVLFTRCMSGMRADCAGTYLKQYRQETGTQSDDAEKIMKAVFDLAKYGSLNPEIESLANGFVNEAAVADDEEWAAACVVCYLLLHYFVFSRDHAFLLKMTGEMMEWPVMGRPDDAVFREIIRVVNLYAGLRLGSTRISPEDIPVNRADEALLTIPKYLVRAWAALQENEAAASIKFAIKMLSLSQTAGLAIYGVMAQLVLKEAYTITNKPAEAEQAEYNLRKLISSFTYEI